MRVGYFKEMFFCVITFQLDGSMRGFTWKKVFLRIGLKLKYKIFQGTEKVRFLSWDLKINFEPQRIFAGP